MIEQSVKQIRLEILDGWGVYDQFTAQDVLEELQPPKMVYNALDRLRHHGVLHAIRPGHYEWLSN